MPTFLRAVSLVLPILFAAPPAAAQPSPRPNVIFILTDDQGSIDAGCYGSTDLKTPHIDSLASRGLRFTQFYAAAPVCSPSRAAILTGRSPLRVGLIGNSSSHKDQQGGLSLDETLLPQLFKNAGYATAHAGKWHLGYTPPALPNARGFDFSFGHMGGCIDNYSHYYFWSGPNVHDLHRNGNEIHQDGQYFPDLMTDAATRFIEEKKDAPFFLYFAMNLPHYPYQPDLNWLEHYKDLPHPRRLYAAFLSTMDDRIGRLLKKLDDLGLREKTIVIFQADNGHSTEDRAHFGGGNAGPYRGAKFSLFEGGIRVPAIISWPGHIPQNQARNQVAHACDWLPTLADLTSLKLPPATLDGKNLVPLLQSSDAPTPHDVLFWDTTPNQWAVRQGKWKLIANPRDTTNPESQRLRIPLFLSNLEEDISEAKDYSKDHPEIVQRLTKLHDDWAAAHRRP